MEPAEPPPGGGQVSDLPLETLLYFCRHVFLPPKLPSGEDCSPRNDDLLMGFVESSVAAFLETMGTDCHTMVQAILGMIKNMRHVRDHVGHIHEESLLQTLNELALPGASTIVPIHVTEQNAGLLIRKADDDMIFEIFEISPDNESAMSTSGRLVRQFPATAIAVPNEVFGEPEFRSVVANTLAKMCHQGVAEMKPQVKKSKQMHAEERDTTKPYLVTELLARFLLELGTQVDVLGVCKNTREEVQWNNSKLPWRRSPTWLLIRVALQLGLRRGGAGDDDTYKIFMVFFLSRILDAAHSQSVDSDLLFAMSAKVSRRLLKLRAQQGGPWFGPVKKTMARVSETLRSRWQTIRDEADPSLSLKMLSSLDIEGDIGFTLPKLDEFVSSISSRTALKGSRNFSPKTQVPPLSPDTFPSHILGSEGSEYHSFRLAAFETWVSTKLDAWLQANIDRDTTCPCLARAIRNYHKEANNYYQHCPEGTSRMLLTILELWVAMDRSATAIHPLLREYLPEVPVVVYQALMLGFLADMERLARAEAYVQERIAFAGRRNRPSVFTSFGNAMSFSNQFFTQSPIHQDIFRRIELHANKCKQDKIDELKRLKKKYGDLINEQRSLSCEYNEGVDRRGFWYRNHSPRCRSCELKNRAEALSIEVHEWPLPSCRLEAQAVVFELNPPPAFQVWRDITLYFIHEVLESKFDQRRPASSHPLSEYPSLKCWHQSTTAQRICLLSETKSHLKTHRRGKMIPGLGKGQVCLNNGLQFQYFDSDRGTFLSAFSPTTEISKRCTVSLPKDSDSLTKFLLRTWQHPDGKAPNEALAEQHLYPRHLSIGEGRALTVLPYGHKIQWMNVLLQLTSPQVDFSKSETATFLVQICMQAGPSLPGKAFRASHLELSKARFAQKLLSALGTCVSRIEKNPECYLGLWTFGFLSARGLSMTGERHTTNFLDILARCRKISYEWVVGLIDTGHRAPEDNQRTQFRKMALDIALVCVDTFTVDGHHLEHVLSNPDEASKLIEMSILIGDNSNLRSRPGQEALQDLLFNRWKILMHRASPILMSQISIRGNAALDLAVGHYWRDFTPEAAWHPSSQAEYWLETSSKGFRLHYNTLTGELLVNGAPLARLPSCYEGHPTYGRVFGRIALEVMPSSVPGMLFSSNKAINGYNIHFGIRPAPDAENDLLVHSISVPNRTVSGPIPDSEKSSSFDLVPKRTLSGSIPDSFAEEYAHWYRHDSGEIEFRPLTAPWAVSPTHWRLSKRKSTWVLTKNDDVFVLNPFGNSSGYIARLFGPLETSLQLHMLYSRKDNRLDIKLPRLQLGFYLECGTSAIQSREFRGMQVDERQSIGTLVGLCSKLTLRASEEPKSRLVLIPDGDIRLGEGFGSAPFQHVQVLVAHGTASNIQSYTVDSRLGRLLDNGTGQSKLFLSYLHALTSYCIPDPLTGDTGTEQALAILDSAAVRSIDHLTDGEAKLLEQLGNLAPDREFYPKHEKVMQRVIWRDGLSFLSQHGLFYTLTRKIVDHVKQISFLFPSHPIPEVKIDHADEHLVRRDLIRYAYLRVSGFGAEEFTTEHDIRYNARDRGQTSQRAARAGRIVKRIHNSSQSIQEPCARELVDILYKLLGDNEGTCNSRVLPDLSDMEYDSKWLAEPEACLPALWCLIHHAFQNNLQWLNRFQVMIWLATMGYSSSDPRQATLVLLALATIPQVAAVPLPQDTRFDLHKGYDFVDLAARYEVHRNIKPLSECPEASMGMHSWEDQWNFAKRREGVYDRQIDKAVDSFMAQLEAQWPCRLPVKPVGSLVGTYIDGRGAILGLTGIWETCYQNFLFRRYLESIAQALDGIAIIPLAVSPSRPPGKLLPANRLPGSISIDDLFREDRAASSNGPCQSPYLNIDPQPLVEEDGSCEKLEAALDRLDSLADVKFRHRYLVELRESITDLQKQVSHQVSESAHDLKKLLDEYQGNCKSHVQASFNALIADTNAVTSVSLLAETETLVADAGFFPRRSATFFLRQLHRSRWPRLSGTWKKKIIAYGLAVAADQRASRLLQLCKNKDDFVKELLNKGHEEWEPHDHPESLLIECESDLLVRKVQQQIARDMISPPGADNAVMQLNMGEGKSSVIVPIVAADLGDGSRLVRVIVAKPQFKQMRQILLAKLGGMVGRRVYQLPISRGVVLDKPKATMICQLVERCMEEGGILLVQPEHLLSLQLMGFERQIGECDDVAGELFRVQKFFDSHSRDVIDESDENFSVKFELVYTVGKPQPIENYPTRWTVVQEVLGLVKRIALEIAPAFPECTEVYNWYDETWRFPRIRILDETALQALLDRLSDCICEDGLQGFPIARQASQVRSDVRRYISHSSLSFDEIAAVENSPFWRASVTKTLLLLRGLIAGGILRFALGQKRWRVNYGIDHSRDPKTQLAVPFRAKDSPAPRSEFSHPDVVTVLTCLSYYYSGLCDDDLFDAFAHVKQDDQAVPEYQAWTASAPKLPLAFRDLIGVNLRDRMQCVTEIFPHLRYSKGAIDYFLSKIVFSREMREFPHKLSASGWDLGKDKKHPTTGFSGTNDSRYVLPISVKQLDLPEQRHTNALVLGYLLRAENSVFLMSKDGNSKVGASEGEFILKLITQLGQETRVILDVGAQIIDLLNRDVAEKWLAMIENNEVQAVIFFDEDDTLSVLDRSGRIEPLQTSSFAKQTDRCLVFLDEAHTRGTDLKLPENYRAAVTLGANPTKDRLVQGKSCMRMRKLGKGQSVVFCIPDEIRTKIVQLGRDPSGITVADVLVWAISETHVDLERSVPLWATQGLRFDEQTRLHQGRIESKSGYTAEWANRFLEDESRSLEHRYRPGVSEGDSIETTEAAGTGIRARILEHCRQFGKVNYRSPSLQEEQERELSPEKEQERQVERPPRVKPEQHSVHADVRSFIQHGCPRVSQGGFQFAFMSLKDTSAAMLSDVEEFPKDLLVTSDFARTVKLNFARGDKSDLFQRPVQWVLTSSSEPAQMVIISPYEAQQLLPEIEASRVVTLHLYSPRMNIGHEPVDDLLLYPIPDCEVKHTISPGLVSILNLFAGQLYLQTRQEYTRVCDMLGLAWSAVEGDATLEADGFIPPGCRMGKFTNRSGFTRSPTAFLISLMKIRRNNQGIEKTHIGRLLGGELLGGETGDFGEEQAPSPGLSLPLRTKKGAS